MPQQIVSAFIRLGIGAALGLVPLIYGILKKQKTFAIASIVMCALFFWMMGWISVIYMALCVFLIYRNDEKYQEAMAKKKRIEEENKIRRQQEEASAEYIPPPSKTRGIWPPINNTMVDVDAARAYHEAYNDLDGDKKE